MLTRETGGTAIGLRIREILHDVASSGLSPTAEALLTAADRAQHIAEIVAPGAGRRSPRRQRSQRLLGARVPGLRTDARRR